MKKISEPIYKTIATVWFSFFPSTQLVVPLESTSAPYYEGKGKCKDYH